MVPPLLGWGRGSVAGRGRFDVGSHGEAGKMGTVHALRSFLTSLGTVPHFPGLVSGAAASRLGRRGFLGFAAAPLGRTDRFCSFPNFILERNFPQSSALQNIERAQDIRQRRNHAHREAKLRRKSCSQMKFGHEGKNAVSYW